MAYFLCVVMCVDEMTPDLFVVRRAVNILNKHTIRIDCLQPPGHLCFVMVVFVLYARKTDAKKGNKLKRE